MRILSLFSGIGVAEAYFKRYGIEVAVANEKDSRRAELFQKIYPHVDMITGDITHPNVFQEVEKLSKKHKIDTILATPPCQGMSRAAGKPKVGDERNNLIIPVLELITKLNPRYVLIENVKNLIEVEIIYKKQWIKVKELLDKLFKDSYHIEIKIVDIKNYDIPQSRIRAIILMTSRSVDRKLDFPRPALKLKTLDDVIGQLPSLDPFVKDTTEVMRNKIFPDFEIKKGIAGQFSIWHKPPTHILRQVQAMMHTPTGRSAFENEIYYPKTADGKKVSGYLSTYRRLRWDRPASTVTMDNRKISSQNNVHPGRLLRLAKCGTQIYSDARCLTTYELMKTMTLPEEWPVPGNTPEAFLRSVIGEGIPPIFILQIFNSVIGNDL